MDAPLRIAVAGKGGVGKTTLAAGLVLALEAEGYDVFALDCDTDGDLAGALGFPPEVLAGLRPLSALADLIEERTGVRPGGTGPMFKLNPQVSDLPDSLCHRRGRVRLLAVDGIDEAGGGCACPANTLVRQVVGEVVARRSEAVVLDMEAGLEHLGRATAASVTCLLAVVEPGLRSVGTARAVLSLAHDLGVAHTFVVGNRFASTADLEAFVRPHVDSEVLGPLPHDPGLVEADRTGAGLDRALAPATQEAIRRILTRIEEVSHDL